MALTLNVNIAWLEAQTGVAYATLRKHYGRWMPSEGANELAKLSRMEHRSPLRSIPTARARR